jgi:hypothetical protein
LPLLHRLCARADPSVAAVSRRALGLFPRCARSPRPPASAALSSYSAPRGAAGHRRALRRAPRRASPAPGIPVRSACPENLRNALTRGSRSSQKQPQPQHRRSRAAPRVTRPAHRKRHAKRPAKAFWSGGNSFAGQRKRRRGSFGGCRAGKSRDVSRNPTTGSGRFSRPQPVA